MNKQKLFLISCISLVTTSMVFAIRGDVESAMSASFHLSKEQMGVIWGPAFWAFTVAIFIGGAITDIVGMRAMHVLSALGYIVGLALVFLAPFPTTPSVSSVFSETGTMMLYCGFLIMGLSQGLVEAVINPLIATIYSDQKTRRLTMLHAWWPGGMIIGGLLAVAMTKMFAASWQLKLGTILVPAAVYLVMALLEKYPATERVASNIQTGEMWRQVARPLFIVLLLTMCMTAAAELGPDQWFPSVMTALMPSMGQGVLFLVYTAGLMFVLRTWGSAVSHKSPIMTLFVCSILTGVGLYWLGSLRPGDSAVMAFAAATIFGVGKTYFWPTMLGVTSEQFPRGGALVISLMGGMGMFAVAYALPKMGARIDEIVKAGGDQAAGGGAALQMMAYVGFVLIFVFAALGLYFKSRGGYKVVHIDASSGH